MVVSPLEEFARLKSPMTPPALLEPFIVTPVTFIPVMLVAPLEELLRDNSPISPPKLYLPVIVIFETVGFVIVMA